MADPLTPEERAEIIEREQGYGQFTRELERYEATVVALESERDALKAERDSLRRTLLPIAKDRCCLDNDASDDEWIEEITEMWRKHWPPDAD